MLQPPIGAHRFRLFTTLLSGRWRLSIRSLDRPESLAPGGKLDRMPIISAFFGIVIRMFYREHEPPHFHAEYQSQLAKFDFDGEIVAGDIRSRTARHRIRKWSAQHRSELEANGKT